MGDEDKITVKAQMVKAQTRDEGCVRVTMDVFGMDDLQCLYVVSLAMKQAVFEFTPEVVDGA
jgi:hypothetical protein